LSSRVVPYIRYYRILPASKVASLGLRPKGAETDWLTSTRVDALSDNSTRKRRRRTSSIRPAGPYTDSPCMRTR
jgi:hypothetical protein